MAKQKLSSNPADYIVPLNINGLEGRMMSVPASGNSQKEILLIYGHHALLERWWSLAENLSDHGRVTVPDLPGFGGMDSFYKIGKKPTVDNFADYLAAFIKMRYRRRRVTIIGISFGFVVITRMLQKYPELTKKVDLLVSMMGFMHKDDFVYKTSTRRFFSSSARLFATPPAATFIRYACLNAWFIKGLHSKLPNSKHRMKDVSPELFNDIMNFDVKIWQSNDVRTHWTTTNEFLQIDNCQQKIALPVCHIFSNGEFYFNNNIVEQHMRVVFTGYKGFKTKGKAHTPHILAGKKETAVMLPPGLKRLLAK